MPQPPTTRKRTTPVLKTQVDETLKARVVQQAAAQGLSESEFLRRLLLHALADDAGSDSPVLPDPTRCTLHRMTIRLPAFLLGAVGERAKCRGMAPSRWIACLVQSQLCQEPVMTDEALLALRENSRELAAIGRNLNQMARALNQAFYDTKNLRLDVLATLLTTIEAQRTAVHALVCASRQAWSTD